MYSKNNKLMVKIFKNEHKISAIGGRVADDYSTLRQNILFINHNLLSFFYLLGYRKPGDVSEIIDILLAPNPISVTTKEPWIERQIQRVKEGKVRLDKYLSTRTLKRISEATEEEAEKLKNKELHRSLAREHKKIYREYQDKYKPSPLGFRKVAIQIFRESIIYTDNGLEIDVDKFLEIYLPYMEAYESETRQQHQAAADAINHFFNGVEITQKELERYFILEYGIVKPKPTSITKQNYARLGVRHLKNTDKNKPKEG